MLKYVPVQYKSKELCENAVKRYGSALEYVPEELKTKELCALAVGNNYRALVYVPEYLKTDDLYNSVINKIKEHHYFPFQEFDGTKEPYEYIVNQKYASLGCIPEKFRTVELCIDAVMNDKRTYFSVLDGKNFALRYVPEEFKTKELCDTAINNFCTLEFIPEQFRTL